MEQPDPSLVKEASADAAERSLVDDVRELVADGRTLLEAELAYQKSRAALAGRTAKSMAGWIALALSLVFFALMALVMGMLLALAPLIGGLGATLVVVAVLLAAAAFSGWVAAKRWNAMSRRLSEDDAA
ncbi:phage holin family protein [Novosphingobium ginsenosidimutans]|uniref:Phage holin family protein n=1 Tax=Novosphingobium ginsenosidimutans TaxID=1176536 RepID=A0A5B8S6I5_9SPHN|nr:phage holin family protein [Novosphingobium ginsenosidimutans]QEA17161.1 phage holin family protein [Novosphingobium ginsenosidimutans]